MYVLLIMVDVVLKLSVPQTLPPLMAVLVPVSQGCTLVMALSVYVSYCCGFANSFYYIHIKPWILVSQLPMEAVILMLDA